MRTLYSGTEADAWPEHVKLADERGRDIYIHICLYKRIYVYLPSST